jgi:hypothetical protein
LHFVRPATSQAHHPVNALFKCLSAIMCMGLATANSLLIVTFAGHVRIRPVLMTAPAMIIGMVPWHWVSEKVASKYASRPRSDWRLDLRDCGYIVLRSRRLHAGEQNEGVTLGHTRLLGRRLYAMTEIPISPDEERG